MRQRPSEQIGGAGVVRIESKAATRLRFRFRRFFAVLVKSGPCQKQGGVIRGKLLGAQQFFFTISEIGALTISGGKRSVNVCLVRLLPHRLQPGAHGGNRLPTAHIRLAKQQLGAGISGIAARQFFQFHCRQVWLPRSQISAGELQRNVGIVGLVVRDRFPEGNRPPHRVPVALPGRLADSADRHPGSR